MSDMQVQVELKLKDDLSKNAGTALDTLGKAAQKAGTAADAIGKGSGVQKIHRDATDAARSMDAVGREARTVEQRIKGAEQSAVAFRRTLSSVQGIARDAASHIKQMGKNLSAAGTGVMAAGAVGKAALDKPVERERALLEMANIAFDAESGKRGKQGAAELDSMVRGAVKFGGGSYGNAMQTTKTLFASGLSYDDIKDILGPILKASTASASPGDEMAQAVAAGLKAKQFTKDQVPLILGQSVKSGSVGSFETKDISRHIAGVMTNAQDMLGVKGYSQHMASLQTMRDASGNSDEAANLYANLQAYRLSPEAADKLKKKYKVNLGKELQAAAARGENLNMAFAEIIKKGVVEKDKKYKSLKARWENAEGEEKNALDREMKVREGMLVGTIIGDRQARQAAIAMYSRREAYDNYLQQIEDNPLAEVESQFQGMQDSTAAKATDAANTRDNAAYGAFLENKGTIDSGLSTVSNFFKEHPNLAIATSEAATVGAMATAGGAAWGGMKFLQGARGAGGVATAATAAQAGTTAGGMAGGARMLARGTAKVAPALALAGSAYEIYSTENDATLSRNEKNIANMETYGGFGGALAGTAMGAAAGSAIPVLGTAIGALIGGIFGYFSGGKAGKATGQMVWGDENPTQQPPQQAESRPLAIEQVINLNVELDGEVVGRVQERRQDQQNLRR